MTHIEKLISNPALMNQADLVLLENKIKENPSIQSYRYLYLSGLVKHNLVKFKEELPKHLAYFNYPKFLEFQFDKIKQFSAPEKNTLQIPLPKNTPNINLEIDENLHIENLKKLGLEHLAHKIIQQKKEIQQAQTKDIKEETQENIIEEPIENFTKAKEPLVSTNEEINSLEDLNLENENVEEQNQKNITEEPIKNFTKAEEPLISTNEEINSLEDLNLENENIEEECLEDCPYVADEEKTLNFIKPNENTEIEEDIEVDLEYEKENGIESEDILDFSNNTEDSEAEIIYETTENTEISYKEKRSFKDWLKINSNPVKTQTKSDKNAKIIDEFIAKNPKIKAVRNPEETPAIDFNALVEDKEILHLMTETLAELYVEQRKFTKAIEAYTILSLKNPEKSSYFANRIEQIKKL